MDDLIIRNGTLVLPDGPLHGDLAICDGRISALGPHLAGGAAAEFDASGLHLLPAVIDGHVHLNEPGRTGWEGFASGSRALASGGGALCCDMPLNSDPPLLDAAAFAAKQAALTAHSLVDVALWGGLTPHNLDRLEELAACGVIGFKAFMSHSGIAEFPAANRATLRAGMRQAAALGRVVAVHAEDDALTTELSNAARAAGRTAIGDYLASRPVAAEVRAIAEALELAEETGCALHVVHVSSSSGLALINSAKARGLNVTAETCPHYLVLNEADLHTIGAAAKCAPPLRPAHEVDALWSHLHAGSIDIIGSDHSPAPAELKTGDDFFAIWGGISGLATSLPLMLEHGYHRRGLALTAIAECMASAPARRFGLAERGSLRVGYAADLALVDLAASWQVDAAALHYRHPISPYHGQTLRGHVVATFRRGALIYRQRVFPPTTGGGILVRPA